eukprot:UN16787
MNYSKLIVLMTIFVSIVCSVGLESLFVSIFPYCLFFFVLL